MAEPATKHMEERIPSFTPTRAGSPVDRFVVGLLLLLIVVAAALVFLTALGLFHPGKHLAWGVGLEQAVEMPGVPHGLGRLAVGVVAAFIGLLAAVLLLRRIFPGSGRSATSTGQHVLVADERGYVVVDKRGIRTIAESAATRVSGVVEARIQVHGAGAAPVRLVLKVWVHAGADLRVAGEKARQRAIEAVEQLVGLQVHDAVVHLEVVPLEELGRVIE